MSVLVPLQMSVYTAVVRTTEGKPPPQKTLSPANAGTPRNLTTMATTPARKTTEHQSINHKQNLIIFNKCILEIKHTF